ncbi:MAG: coenzyme F420-0:L-glutamate ligase [Candidatus Brockarchaeota archaeon]|nr:coenzyme F420-0:L-glutamate ligase [Candidatus Brockarchaeota archaeon]
MIRIFGIKYDGFIKKGDNLAKITIESLRRTGVEIENRDVVTLTHVAVSKAMGYTIRLSDVKPTPLAIALADRLHKPPEEVEIILRESREIVRLSGGRIITRNRGGIICANSGIDFSNVDGGLSMAFQPRNPDRIARKIRRQFLDENVDVGIIITDSFERPFRMGQVNMAIGCSGIAPIKDLRGKTDLFGYVLRFKRMAIVDELAAASELVTGSSSEGFIGALIKGYQYEFSDEGVKSILRNMKNNLFL